MAAKTDLTGFNEALTVAIVQRLPVPDHDTPLENLIKLRCENDAFRSALNDMLDWKRVRAHEILAERDRRSAIEAAMKDFDKTTRAYSDAMHNAGYRKVVTVGSILFSLATHDFVGAIKEGLVSFKEMREPCWKSCSEKKFAPGGVVYHFREATE